MHGAPMTPIERGDLSVAMITAAFLRSQWVVLKPLSEGHRYDLVIDRGNGFERVQCKTGRLRRGAVLFNACSSLAHHRGRNVGRRGYRGQIEIFAVYCPETDEVYVVPVQDVPENDASLRVEAPKNNQTTGIKLASDYRI